MGRGRIRKLIIPLILEQLLAVTVGFFDTFMVSRVGEAAVSGVALVDSINLLIIQVMTAFAAGGIVVISQYIGQKNDHLSKETARHLEILINAFSIFVMVVFLLLGDGILKLLFGKIEQDVMNAAVIYLKVTAVSFVFWGMYTSGASILRCQEDTKTPMVISFLMNVLNVLLNALFVFGLHMGVLGVAVATLISRGIAGIVMKGVLLSSRNQLRLINSDRKISGAIFKSILSMGIPSGVENGMFHLGKLALTSVISTLGTTAIAANSISYQIIEFPNIPAGTIGLALVVIVGQDIGAGKKEEAVKDTKYMLRLAFICDWVCKITLFFVAPVIVSFFNLSPEASSMAIQVLRIFSIVSLFIWPLSYTLPNALRGAGDVKYSMLGSIISMWIGRVIVSYVLITYFGLGILGVWIGMFVDWFGRGGAYLYRFLSSKWLDKKAI